MAVFDIDGTLADVRWREKYAEDKDWDKFHSLLYLDKPRPEIADIARSWKKRGATVIQATGRPRGYFDSTKSWLRDHDIPSESVYMRPFNDHRKDHVVKPQLISQAMADFPHCKIVAVYDDRPSVIQAYRKMGLPVIDVGTGHELDWA